MVGQSLELGEEAGRGHVTHDEVLELASSAQRAASELFHLVYLSGDTTPQHAARTRIFQPDLTVMRGLFHYSWDRCAVAISPSWSDAMMQQSRILRIRFEVDQPEKDTSHLLAVESRTIVISFARRKSFATVQNRIQYFAPAAMVDRYDVFMRDFSDPVSSYDEMGKVESLTGAECRGLTQLIESSLDKDVQIERA